MEGGGIIVLVIWVVVAKTKLIFYSSVFDLEENA